jgi:hypothetical protein
MQSSNPSNPSRSILKLKTAPRNREVKTPPPKPQSKLSQKPGAAWSDEFKSAMQREMDALATR